MDGLVSQAPQTLPPQGQSWEKRTPVCTTTSDRFFPLDKILRLLSKATRALKLNPESEPITSSATLN